jgi:hypothetical protein
MSKALVALAFLALTTLATEVAVAAPKSPTNLASQAQIPSVITGRWIALSTTAMGITGDMELRDGQLRTRRGAIPLKLEKIRLASYDGEMWISKIGPTARNALINGNQFCPHKGYPDQGRWLVISRPTKNPDRIDIDVYETWEMPVQFGSDKPYYCGGMGYERDDHPGGKPHRR